ncbi:MAG: hypothetical protein EBR82_43070 [Caulobacteraceae bacterium]|nr:hypothetical protein [Caulobacteraceae bacterium]
MPVVAEAVVKVLAVQPAQVTTVQAVVVQARQVLLELLIEEAEAEAEAMCPALVPTAAPVL